MNYLDEINNGLFKESEHRTKMNIPPQADLLGFILVEQNSKVPVSRIVLNNQGPTFIYMTSKQMKKSFDRDIFICPHLQLIFNLSLTCDDKTVPLALYALQDGPDVKIIMGGFDDEDLEKIYKSIPSPNQFTIRINGALMQTFS